MFACSSISKFLEQHGIKMSEVGPSITRQHVQQLQLFQHLITPHREITRIN